MPTQCAGQCTEKKYPYYAVQVASPTKMNCLCVTKVSRISITKLHVLKPLILLNVKIVISFILL